MENALMNHSVNEVYDLQHLVIDNERMIAEKYIQQLKRKYLEANILDNQYLIEIVNIMVIVIHPNITRYTEYIGCAFIEVDGEQVLTIELRDNREVSEDTFIVIAEVRLKGKKMYLGFIVNRVKDFYKRIL